MTKSPHPSREPWFLRFHDLMRFMVREVLVVSPAYDAFIMEEDGRLEDRLVSVYTEHSLSLVPRITHVSTARRCLEVLEEARFDMVITVVRLEDADAGELSRQIKQRHPGLPVVLLAFDEADVTRLPALPATIDRTFLWTGDAQMLIAAIKLVEDARNVAADTNSAGVQVIIVVEDSMRRYSTFLALLYNELMSQSRSLIAEGLNPLHRLMRMRARPKILLTTTYEEALGCYRRFHENVLAVISDVRFPRAGIEDPEAGFELARAVRATDADLPLMLQSAEPELEARVLELSAWYANKNSATLLEQIRQFLKEALGFGDFVFRLPDRTEVGVAHDLYELRQQLVTLPVESLEFHASRNHFSMWLRARGMFELAGAVKPRTVGEFEGLDNLRQYLLDVLQQQFSLEQEGVITDYSPKQSGTARQLVRVGHGSIGGKGRGIAFVNAMLARHDLHERFAELDIKIPKTVVVGADEFDRFLEENALSRESLLAMDQAQVLDRFLEGQLRENLLADLESVFRDLTGPLAVRSSSLLEDSRFQPFAGIYATYILPNNHPDPKIRSRELRQAIKAVYASTFSRDARSYFSGIAYSVEEEKMAVVVQELVGIDYGERFYPHLSGVAQSHNYYPVGGQRAEDGVALIVLGLGHAVASGGVSLRVCPRFPEKLPQFATPRDFFKASQTSFFALDLTRQVVDFRAVPEASLGSYDLATAGGDGSLALVGSVYDASDDVIRDNPQVSGPSVVTFNNILKWNELPVAEALTELLQVFRKGMGGDVELEFAANFPAPGRDLDARSCLYVLQVRPMATAEFQGDVQGPADLDEELVFARTQRALGHGRIDAVRDVVYVKPMVMDATRTPAVAREVGSLTAPLQKEGTPFMLIGPGRWGTADPGLGIPVEWAQIAGARVIIETPADSRPIEPSQGTHFLQNITYLRMGYLTVASGLRNEYLDLAWLDAQAALAESQNVRHVRLAAPMTTYLDGRHGHALVVKGATESATS